MDHSLLLTLGYRDGLTEIIDFAVICASDGALVGSTHKEELSVIGLVRYNAEDKLRSVGALYLIESRDKPGICDLRIEFLVLIGQFSDIGDCRIFQLEIGMALLEDAHPLLGFSSRFVVHVIFNIKVIGIHIPIVEKPVVCRVLPDGINDVRGNLIRTLLDHLSDRVLRVVALGEIGDYSRHGHAEQEEQYYLSYEA